MTSALNLALVLIDLQKGFLNSDYWGKRNNPKMEKNIERLLKEFRDKNLPIIHIRHHSTEPLSPLRPELSGSEFMDFANPIDEMVITKSVNSAFIGTPLESHLRNQKIMKLVMVGLTSDHCVSTSARMAANLGFEVTIAEDAVATFDRTGFDGIKYEAELVQEVSLASLRNEFAAVLSTEEIIKNLSR